jgi:ribosomal protein S18 acetylase RimI-like enzyme
MLIRRFAAFLLVGAGARARAMTSPLTIRPALAADEQALGRLGSLLVIEHYEFDPQRFLAPRPDMPQAYGHFLASQIGQPDKLVLVAEQAGAIVGYGFAGIEGFDYMALRGPAAVLYDLVVDPDHRRQGIGTALLDAAFVRLSELGAPRVLLFTAEKNHAAQSVFERSGFRRTMIEMTRELS